MLQQRHTGMFKPGQSGNPSGRPKADIAIRDVAREHTIDAIQTLVEIAKNSKASDSARVQACNAILDRGWGKPVQASENLNMNISYIDFLDGIAKADKEQQVLIEGEKVIN